MRLDDLDYDLPEDRIALTPADRRDAARLMVMRGSAPAAHHHVSDLPQLLRSGDVLVLNDTRVLPARFAAVRDSTGGHLEGLFLEVRPRDQAWHVLLKSGGRLQVGERVSLGGHGLTLLDRLDDGSWWARSESDRSPDQVLEAAGVMPLPPYILGRRDEARNWDALDRQRYQTVFAREAGAVAAPTAGLHFTDDLLKQLRSAGITPVTLTLHVGAGTFAPVRTESLEDHVMHAESFSVPAATLRILHEARSSGRRIIPVGTTSVRAMESLPAELDCAKDYRGSTRLMICPPYTFRYADGMMTNFHLPKSTLLALVAAKVGLDRLKQLYAQAVAEQYRFFSYGDAMLMLDD